MDDPAPRAPRSGLWRAVLALTWACLLVGPAWAGTLSLEPSPAGFERRVAYPDRPLLGPAQAKGAVIWSHGRSATPDPEPAMLPFYLDRLRDAGWDVFRLDRPWSDDSFTVSVTALRNEVAILEAQGYGKVVLAGQSFGAWLSFLVDGEPGPPVYAVIATAPAAYGAYPDSPVWKRNAEALGPVLRRVHDTRVLLFLFAGDEYDPGGRGALARQALEGRGNSAVIVDDPAEWVGHGAANWPGFAHRFGGCIVRFVDPALDAAAAATAAHCESDPTPRVAQIGVPLPAELKPVSLGADAPEPLAAMAGLWYGVYDNGREAVLAIDRIVGSEVGAIYGWGQLLRGDTDHAGYDRRVGRWQAGRVVFEAPGDPSLTARPLGDGRIELQWLSADHQEQVRAVLRRLDGAKPEKTPEPPAGKPAEQTAGITASVAASRPVGR